MSNTATTIQPQSVSSQASREWALGTLPPRPRPTPTSLNARVISHRAIGARYMDLVLEAPLVASRAEPGQFVMLTVARPGRDTPALPRPMALYSVDARAGRVQIRYGVVGDGTREMATYEPGESMFVVGPLGRTFEVGDNVASVLLIGRGIGTCSLTTVAESNQARGIRTIAVTSSHTAADSIGGELYRATGAHLYEVTDAEGSSRPGALYDRLTSDWDENPPELLLTCGSRRLSQLCERLAERWGATVQVSVEAHMACGLGYCHGCASGARSEGEESPLICQDGPVFSWRTTAQTPSS